MVVARGEGRSLGVSEAVCHYLWGSAFGDGRGEGGGGGRRIGWGVLPRPSNLESVSGKIHSLHNFV